jgi:hypothetical protein
MNRAKNTTVMATILVSILIWPGFFCRCLAAPPVQGQKSAVISEVIGKWLEIARRQCERRMYEQANESLMRAVQYRDFLSESQLKQIDELSKKVQDAQGRQKRLVENVDKANSLMEQGELLKARAYLLESAKGDVLSKDQAARAKRLLDRVNADIEQQKKLMAELYRKSREAYHRGDIEKAREGFQVVASSGLYIPRFGKSAEQYLAQIEHRGELEKKPAGNKRQEERHKEQVAAVKSKGTPGGESRPRAPIEALPSANLPSTPGAAETFANASSEANAVTENLKAEYVRAVIRDAQSRATMHAGRAEFSSARAVVQNAETTLQVYKADLDPQLYGQYDKRLQELAEMIDDQQKKWLLRWDTKDSGL